MGKKSVQVVDRVVINYARSVASHLPEHECTYQRLEDLALPFR